MEEIDRIKEYPLLECTAPLEGQSLPPTNVVQSTSLHLDSKEEGLEGLGLLKTKIIHSWSALHPYRAGNEC